MSEIQVFSEELEMAEITANFQKMSIGDLKEVLVKDGKQVLKDIFSDRRLDKNTEKKIKDHRKRNAISSKNIFKLTYGNMKIRQMKDEKRKAVRQINNKIDVLKKSLSKDNVTKITTIYKIKNVKNEKIEADGKSVSKDNVKFNKNKGLENLKNLLLKNDNHLIIKTVSTEHVVKHTKNILIKNEKIEADSVSKDNVKINNNKGLEKLKKLLLKDDKHLIKKTVSTEHIDENSEKKIEADIRSVFVGNVDYGATAHLLEKIFSRCGKINRVSIPINTCNGKPKGFAYIEFNLPLSVEKAIKMNGFMLRGRPIQVKYKRTNKPGLSTTNRPSFEQVHHRSRKTHEECGKTTPKVFNAGAKIVHISKHVVILQENNETVGVVFQSVLVTGTEHKDFTLNGVHLDVILYRVVRDIPRSLHQGSQAPGLEAL
ncbi:PREDICTED: nucleolin-like [Nicrophorus vespilloides]|uniref:Nucleolin-like n=1 Tax=Nicrophorus vespilloides TaxID=110193 RepID=A0ABM1M2W6_NICVS|nr:PREDICTED: nucleolin-like [Nicrophorus vespilloides]